MSDAVVRNRAKVNGRKRATHVPNLIETRCQGSADPRFTFPAAGPTLQLSSRHNVHHNYIQQLVGQEQHPALYISTPLSSNDHPWATTLSHVPPLKGNTVFSEACLEMALTSLVGIEEVRGG
jgi:hypothetical protein